MSIIREKLKKKKYRNILILIGIFLIVIVIIILSVQVKKHKEQDAAKKLLLQESNTNYEKQNNQGSSKENSNVQENSKIDAIIEDKTKVQVQEEIEKMYDDEEVQNDVRLQSFNYINLSSKMNQGDYIDIRIHFEDGTDFIVLSKKKILYIEQTVKENVEIMNNMVWITISEEELLRISSAAVDALLSEGSYIYALEYVKEEQTAAVVNYSVKDNIKRLIKEDPNIIKKAANVLESKLCIHGKKVKTKIEDEIGNETVDNTSDVNGIKSEYNDIDYVE